MTVNYVDVLSWIIVIVVTTVILYHGVKKYGEPNTSQNGKYIFYVLTIIFMMSIFTMLAFFKTGYSYDSENQKCMKTGFGYWGYSSEDECLRNEKKDVLTGLAFFQ